jgi:FMN-dependent NADH-azoreductase
MEREVKNCILTKELRLTSQLKDFMDSAKIKDITFKLYLNQGVKIHPML